ncbi:hypothetical protein KGM_204295 [Danaus plexippus plexippus]|uniref:Uncharacterized protein n=1 Tax=Danaus plexippus plexippus TaxID=278856 RepID=A0A212F078_DANPL|nr:hypothetical protein KGM_204295 [Danaus plexippus plexippus]
MAFHVRGDEVPSSYGVVGRDATLMTSLGWRVRQPSVPSTPVKVASVRTEPSD